MTLTLDVKVENDTIQMNDGENVKIKKYTYTVEKVYMYTCGCSRLPKLIQNANGITYNDYRGESFRFECECGIRTQSITNNQYHDQKKYEEKLKEILTTLIITWNNAMFNNNSSIVKLVCR